MAPAHLAATLILYRAGGGAAEVLMVERAGGMAFAGGAMVFPGGRVDRGDIDTGAAAFAGVASDMASAYVAAVRETIEEVGIAVGLTPVPADPVIARIRGGLAAGRAFAALLGEEGLRLDTQALTPFARWRPAAAPVRVFDAIFFVAEAPANAIAEPDGGESVRVVWGTPRTLLDAADAGRHRMLYPTRRNLERLARLDTIVAARAHAAAFPITTITPFREMRQGVEWLCIPEGRGYPITGEPLATVRRQ